MQRLVRHGLLAGLLAVVCIELIVLNLSLIPSIYLLKDKEVPRYKKQYEDIQKSLDEIALLKDKTTIDEDTVAGPPKRETFRTLSRTAGIVKSPQFRTWSHTQRQGQMKEMPAEVKIFGETASPLFKFLQNVDNLPGTGRIKTLSLNKTRGKTNEFDLTMRYSTFSPPE